MKSFKQFLEEEKIVGIYPHGDGSHNFKAT